MELIFLNNNLLLPNQLFWGPIKSFRPENLDGRILNDFDEALWHKLSNSNEKVDVLYYWLIFYPNPIPNNLNNLDFWLSDLFIRHQEAFLARQDMLKEIYGNVNIHVF